MEQESYISVLRDALQKLERETAKADQRRAWIFGMLVLPVLPVHSARRGRARLHWVESRSSPRHRCRLRPHDWGRLGESRPTFPPLVNRLGHVPIAVHAASLVLGARPCVRSPGVFHQPQKQTHLWGREPTVSVVPSSDFHPTGPTNEFSGFAVRATVGGTRPNQAALCKSRQLRELLADCESRVNAQSTAGF